MNLPSAKSDKSYSDIQPGQRILPLGLPENYGEVPWFVKADLLLEREQDLHILITRKLETNISEDADPDLFQEAEELGEEIFQLRQKLRDEYNLEPGEDEDTDLLMEGRIKEDQDKIVKKLSEIKKWSRSQCEELREEYRVEVVDRPLFDCIVFEIDDQRYTTDSPSSVDGLRRMENGDAQNFVTKIPEEEKSEADEKAVEFVKKRFNTLIEANDRLHDWMEEKGYEQVGQVETSHYFEKDGFTVVVPWSADSSEDIQIRN
ncbi:hypothetical protein ACM16X_02425 [Haloarcula japonica]|uniref:hypothetical protein n=1 Tax=Haloarcula japonica TaxID=29282 RepID=UPI0039F72A9D